MSASTPSPSTAPRPTKRARLDLRLDADQKRLFEAAAGASDRTMTEFVLQSAEAAARSVLADRSRFALDPVQWAAFSAAVDAEPRALPRLARFLGTPSVLEE